MPRAATGSSPRRASSRRPDATSARIRSATAACTSKAKLEQTDINEAEFGLPPRPLLVALASRGTAIKFKRGSDYGYPDNGVQGDVVTGGGAVRGEPVDFFYEIDTSGTSPALAECEQAMADIRAASAALAARPPTQVFGAVRVRTDETMVIDATGGAVIQMDSLIMDAADGRYYGYEKNCNGVYAADHEPARLEIHANQNDDVVINVDRLAIGGCTRLLLDRGPGLPNVVFNVPGKGKRIDFGPEGGTEGSPAILAPDRTLSLSGSPDSDTLTQVATAWVRNLKLVGGTGIPGCCVDGWFCN